MSDSSQKITDLSSHLFWDVDVSSLNYINSKKLIIERVLEYGLITDWKHIIKIYGLSQIKETVIKLKRIDPVSLSFLSTLFDLPKQAFECYKNNQSTPNYWNY